MKRRELLKHTLLAAGAGITGMAPALAQEAQKKVYAGENELLKGQEGDGASPRETHAYSMGLQAFQYGWPLIYFANLMWQWSNNPKSVQRPLNSWITTKDFVATSNYRDGGSFNTDTCMRGPSSTCARGRSC
jgi:hypothetical protein